ncbi:DNA-deoxyinosine glycosylase [Xenophilus sp. Marseille-Q4582]|uniref:DNA-deoxyinosine glycosylase n=1 Tax=Xenophilus sp. Marseille-Q4582 TaxID=2866600 RepID=UPI001CE4474B|nr:DNA-deoxyinosine glycosylase [Xenophilus sp. Marseille-Q4582]
MATVSVPLSPVLASAAAPAPEGGPCVLQGLAPVAGPGTVLLILGSFPGVRSLQLQQYYAHPQNQFWKILQALWPQHPLPGASQPGGYAARCRWLLDRGLGLWDVYARCTRSGSLDSAIRDAVPNDIAGLKLPRLKAVAHNGGESFRHARHTAQLGVPVHRLPSTSPANASWTFERKLGAWRAVVAEQGLL